ncbi:lysophospholipid acyltransferase family protein [Candidatus Poribacteria bacterium]|nr:lysophospholipid acyltransferase family protein [Candidatus Poribacteria bacterium]
MKDWCYLFIAKLTGYFVSILPRKISLKIGGLLGGIVYKFSLHQRNIAYENIRHSLKNTDEKFLKIYVKQCFQNLGKTAVEFMQFPKKSKELIQDSVQFQGIHHIENALSQGNGAIILTGHFGNWELLAASISTKVAPLTPIVRHLRSHRLNELVTKYRKIAGYTTIDRDTGIRDALRCLRTNNLLGIVADVDTTVNGVFVDFFGRPAYTPYSPIAFALKTGAAILPSFIIRQPDGSHHAIIEPMMELIQTDNKEQDIIDNTQKFTNIIENYIQKYPEQWIWMHERWKTQP